MFAICTIFEHLNICFISLEAACFARRKRINNESKSFDSSGPFNRLSFKLRPMYLAATL